MIVQKQMGIWRLSTIAVRQREVKHPYIQDVRYAVRVKTTRVERR